MSEDEVAWRAWYDTADSGRPIPGDYGRCGGAFDRLLLIRCWRPDLVLHEARNYIVERLGREYLTEPSLLHDDLATLARQTDCRSPLVGLMSTSADPTQGIEAAARKLKIGA